MFGPYSGPQDPLEFRTYDLEWYPETYQVRLVGQYDGARYRAFQTVRDFLKSELIPDNRGMTWFAHAGGLADVQFILQEIMRERDKWEVKASFSGSSAIIVTVSDGFHEWHFCDSYWLLRDSLAKIGKSLGQEKGGKEYHCPDFPACGHVEGKCIFYAPVGILKDYNELDCRILYNAIIRLQDELLELGGTLRKTIASCAMHLFRSAYLHQPIDTLDFVNDTCRKAYVASRVEVFREKCDSAHYYDINSSFPHSMTRALPGSFTSIQIEQKGLTLPKGLYIADCLVRVKPCYIPPLPYRIAGKVFFPHGTWRSWFTGYDLQKLLESGGKVLGVYSLIRFEEFHDMSAYAHDIYGRRQVEKDEFRRLVYKYLLNSLYGKTAEREEKKTLHLNPEFTTCQHDPKHADNSCVEMIQPGMFLISGVKELRHVHVPIAAYVTAYSRHLLTDLLLDADRRKGECYYCDTDSIVTTAEMPTGVELGKLKCEAEVTKGLFIAPKFYTFNGKVKAKGFSRISVEDFERLIAELKIDPREREGVAIKRMIRLRELYRKGESAPRDLEQRKRLWLDVPKRRKIGNNTEPWSVDDLKAMWPGDENGQD